MKTVKKTTRPTLRTISEITGFAVPTVSRALSGAQDIGASTRLRVREVADEIGYIPNRAGVRLRTGRSYVVSLVLSTETDMMNLTARLINAVAAELRGTRYNLTITPVFPDEDPLIPIRNIVENKAADAIILNQTKPDDPRVAYLMEQGFPFATHGRTQFAENHDYYDFDNRACGDIAVQRLAARGRTKLALLAPPRDQFYATEMIDGAFAGAKAEGVDIKLIEDATSDSPANEIEAAIGNLLDPQVYGADAIICGSSGSCMACATAVEDAGLVVAKDVDLFSKEAISFLDRFRPGILTQFEDVGAAGSSLARAVLARLDNPDQPLSQHLEVPHL